MRYAIHEKPLTFGIGASEVKINLSAGSWLIRGGGVCGVTVMSGFDDNGAFCCTIIWKKI